MKRIVIFFCLLSLQSFSQEVVSDLISNTSLEKSTFHAKNHSILSIPFIDDFSNVSSYPDSNLWEDNLVSINRNYDRMVMHFT